MQEFAKFSKVVDRSPRCLKDAEPARAVKNQNLEENVDDAQAQVKHEHTEDAQGSTEAERKANAHRAEYHRYDHNHTRGKADTDNKDKESDSLRRARRFQTPEDAQSERQQKNAAVADDLPGNVDGEETNLLPSHDGHYYPSRVFDGGTHLL